jgi:hypothetical protein
LIDQAAWNSSYIVKYREGMRGSACDEALIKEIRELAVILHWHCKKVHVLAVEITLLIFLSVSP